MGKRGKMPQHDEEIRQLLEEGKSYKEVAETLGICKDTVKAAVKRLGLNLCRGKKKKNDEEVAELVKQKQPEWEYVDGYTGIDGRMNLRHKACGTITDASSITVRQGKTIRCKCCAEKEREERLRQEKEQKERERELKKERKIKTVKYTLQKMKQCPQCGGFFFSDAHNTKYCSEECARQKENHRLAMKKEMRRRRAQTKESKEISIMSLYKRDGGICWLCGGMCDLETDTNANEYPSIDHIKPISLGGKDEWGNVRLAHRICNSVRGNRLKCVGVPEIRSPLCI